MNTSKKTTTRTLFFILMMLAASTLSILPPTSAQNDGEKQTMTDDSTDHYSSRSVRLSADTTNIGSNERKILIENDYEVTYGTYFKIVRMKCGFDHAVSLPHSKWGFVVSVCVFDFFR